MAEVRLQLRVAEENQMNISGPQKINPDVYGDPVTFPRV